MKYMLSALVFCCTMANQARLQTYLAPTVGMDYFQTHIETDPFYHITPQDNRIAFTYGGQLQQEISKKITVGLSVMHVAKDFNGLFWGFVGATKIKSRISRMDYSVWGYYYALENLYFGAGGTYSNMDMFSYLDRDNIPAEVKETYWTGASLAYRYGNFWLELRYNHGLKTRSIISNGDTQDYFFRSPPSSTALTLRYLFQVLPLKNRRKEKCPEF
jgi:hypothetical protein